MDQIFLFIIIGVIGVGFGYLLAAKKKIAGSKSPSLNAADKVRARMKEKAKEKVLTLAQSQKRVTNDDVQELLNVSHATATNYLQELENERRVVQHGETGQSVYYTPK